MTTIQQILDFVQETIGSRKVNPKTDIFLDLGVDGDDFDDIIFDYSKKFNVDMENYLWYFHAGEEGTNIGGLFFAPPNRRVERIPITPEVMLKFARTGKWDIPYPLHQLPKRRYDIIIS